MIYCSLYFFSGVEKTSKLSLLPSPSAEVWTQVYTIPSQKCNRICFPDEIEYALEKNWNFSPDTHTQKNEKGILGWLQSKNALKQNFRKERKSRLSVINPLKLIFQGKRKILFLFVKDVLENDSTDIILTSLH